MKNIDLISSLQQESQTTPEPKVIFLIIFIYRKKKKNGIGQIMMTMKRKN